MTTHTQPAYPLCLNLPHGDALLIPGSAERGQPQYERDGLPLVVDVTIPDDLAPLFYWWGSFLALTQGSVMIATITYPPNGEDGRATCYDQARKYLERRAELRAARAAERPKKTKRPPLPKGVRQMELGL